MSKILDKCECGHAKWLGDDCKWCDGNISREQYMLKQQYKERLRNHPKRKVSVRSIPPSKRYINKYTSRYVTEVVIYPEKKCVLCGGKFRKVGLFCPPICSHFGALYGTFTQEGFTLSEKGKKLLDKKLSQ